jgi:hypothetical protein
MSSLPLGASDISVLTDTSETLVFLSSALFHPPLEDGRYAVEAPREIAFPGLVGRSEEWPGARQIRMADRKAACARDLYSGGSKEGGHRKSLEEP